MAPKCLFRSLVIIENKKKLERALETQATVGGSFFGP